MSAIGPNNCPSGPCMVNSGMKAQTMMSVENNSARVISPEASRMRSLMGRSACSPLARWR